MNTPPRVMLLIDADNVSADVIEQAVERTMTEHGAIHVRRAYCNAETAMKQQGLFKRLSVRPMVNLSAGKNSTDIALAVDAMDLAVAERPDIAVLVSSDSDFAPLVIRLREKGCRVCGIGQQGKTGDDTVAIYDSFIDLQHHQAPKAAVAKTAAKRAPRRVKAVAPRAAPPAPVLPEEVIRILDAVAELGMGNKVELNVAAERLRAAKLLGKSASSPKLFKKHPELFLLTPEKTPNKVQYVGPVPS
ncbi:NYN domain-containing protein [Variovorax sp. J22P240]|uniref:NYN domain-containing protein n=1 Tax=unclassified Variovorax TaxID=663243 RepID=UPI002576A589|nr:MULTISPECIES: NYN domain-containing protein [unclassified Variovorax]MDL9999554.1 NYN domain-containing protein [Variovorax sp. J22P240]MDM0048983.1 NYN domain-containing protein [Variovorax sp. J22R115]